ncbi:short-chain dehydrogenase, partial [Oenococcus kitaharae]
LSQSSKGTAYESSANQAADKMRQLYSSKHLSKATLVSQTILKVASSAHPRPRYLVGTGAKSLVLLHTILPSQIFDPLIKKLF